MNSAGRTGRAFTLLELLVALAMTAVLAGALYATLAVSFRAQSSATRAADEPRRAQITLERIANDLRCAAVPNDILASTFLGEDDYSTDGFESDSLSLCLQAPAGQLRLGASDLRTVELVCETEPDSNALGRNLFRRVTGNQLAPTLEDPEEDPDDEILCRGVRRFSLRYFDGVEWLDGWDSTTEDNVLPLAVEITLELEPPARNGQRASRDEKGYRAVRVVRIPCSSLTVGTVSESTGGTPAP